MSIVFIPSVFKQATDYTIGGITQRKLSKLNVEGTTKDASASKIIFLAKKRIADITNSYLKNQVNSLMAKGDDYDTAVEKAQKTLFELVESYLPHICYEEFDNGETLATVISELDNGFSIWSDSIKARFVDADNFRQQTLTPVIKNGEDELNDLVSPELAEEIVYGSTIQDILEALSNIGNSEN